MKRPRDAKLQELQQILKDRQVMDWLLEEDQPSVRYHTLIDVLGRKENDSEVRRSYSEIPRKGWAKDLLELQKPEGYWEAREPKSGDFRGWLDFLYFPDFFSTNRIAVVLSDLGLTSKDPRIGKIADLYFKYKMRLGTMVNIFTDEVCIVGNAARMLTRFGYADDYRVKKLFDRLVEDQKEDGGWQCFELDRGTLDSWEGMAAYAALPKSKHTKKIRNSIERGAEFYLERRLFKEGKKKYLPWFRLHYPNHYFYDILVGMDMLTALGYGNDKRLRPAVDILLKKRRSDGTWPIEKAHPDIGAGAQFRLHTGSKPFALEPAGKPSKWITMTAMRVLKRIDEAS
jgi:hypothetical protein